MEFGRGKQGYLAIALLFVLFLSSLLFSIPASAVTGTLPGEYPPVYPLRRPSYGINSLPLKRPSLGTTKIATADYAGGLLKSDGTIEWLNSSTYRPETVNRGNLVDFAVGYELGPSNNLLGQYDSAITLDKDGKVYAASNSADSAVTAAVAAINTVGSDWQKGDVVQVQCGGGHFVGLKADGTVISAGRNHLGQLPSGDGTTGAVKIVAKETATMVLKYDGTAYTFGRDSMYGAYNAAKVASWKTVTSNPIVDIASQRHGCSILRADGTLETAPSPYSGAYTDSTLVPWKAQDVVQIVGTNTGLTGMKSDGSTISTGGGLDYMPASASAPKAFQLFQAFYACSAFMSDGSIRAAAGSFHDVGYPNDLTTQFPKVDYRPYVISSLATGTSYTAPQTVELSGNHDLYQTIYYTTDGTDPQTSSTRKLYTSPIAINGDITIKAVPYSASEGAYGATTDFTYTFTYPQIVPSKASGAFLNPFKLTATAGACQVRYTTSNRDVQLTDPVLPAQGLTVEKTVTVRLAADFGGRLVSPLELSYTKTDTGVMAAKDSLKLQFRASSSGAWGDTPVWTQGAQVQASVSIEKIVDEQLPAVLVLLVEDTSGGSVRTIARKVSFVNVTASGQAATALLTLPEGASGALRAKAFLMDGFARLRPVSVIVTK